MKVLGKKVEYYLDAMVKRKNVRENGERGMGAGEGETDFPRGGGGRGRGVTPTLYIYNMFFLRRY